MGHDERTIPEIQPPNLRVAGSRFPDLNAALAWVVQESDLRFPGGPHKIEIDVYWEYDGALEPTSQWYSASVSGPVE